MLFLACDDDDDDHDNEHVQPYQVTRPCPSPLLLNTMALPFFPAAYQPPRSHLEQCDPMSAPDVEPGTASVILQIKQQTSVYHVGLAQGVKGVKDPKTKETHNTLFLSQCSNYQMHKHDTRSGAKERRIENQRSQGDHQIAMHGQKRRPPEKGGCFWAFVPNEVCCTCTTLRTRALSPGTALKPNAHNALDAQGVLFGSRDRCVSTIQDMSLYAGRIKPKKEKTKGKERGNKKKKEKTEKAQKERVKAKEKDKDKDTKKPKGKGKAEVAMMMSRVSVAKAPRHTFLERSPPQWETMSRGQITPMAVAVAARQALDQAAGPAAAAIAHPPMKRVNRRRWP